MGEPVLIDADVLAHDDDARMTRLRPTWAVDGAEAEEIVTVSDTEATGLLAQPAAR